MLALDPRVVDAVWAVQGHLPPRPHTPPLGCHRPRIPDHDNDRFSLQRLGQIPLAIALILTVKLVKWAKRWTDKKRPSARALSS